MKRLLQMPTESVCIVKKIHNCDADYSEKWSNETML